jgi:hypothetical protein
MNNNSTGLRAMSATVGNDNKVDNSIDDVQGVHHLLSVINLITLLKLQPPGPGTSNQEQKLESFQAKFDKLSAEIQASMHAEISERRRIAAEQAAEVIVNLNDA